MIVITRFMSNRNLTSGTYIFVFYILKHLSIKKTNNVRTTMITHYTLQ